MLVGQPIRHISFTNELSFFLFYQSTVLSNRAVDGMKYISEVQS